MTSNRKAKDCIIIVDDDDEKSKGTDDEVSIISDKKDGVTILEAKPKLTNPKSTTQSKVNTKSKASVATPPLYSAEQCSICLEDYASKPFINLSCGHRFHIACINDWWTNFAKRELCAFCRQSHSSLPSSLH